MEQNYNPFENSPTGEEQQERSTYNHTIPNPPKMIRPNYFETMSIILSIGAFFSCAIFYGAYIMGALAILFALLSRGGQMRLSKKAKLGLLLGIAAIIFSTLLTIGAYYIAIEEYGSIENMLREYCQMYGLDFEKEFGNLFQ